MGEHSDRIQQGVGPTIGVTQTYPAAIGWRLMLTYVAISIAGVWLLAT